MFRKHFVNGTCGHNNRLLSVRISDAISISVESKKLKILDQIYDTLETFVANKLESDATRRSRRKSGWATFLSWLRIGSQDDIEILNANIQQLQAATQLGFEQFAVTADKFHSFAHLTTQHLQELNHAVASQAAFSLPKSTSH
jgi:hypothetical protein